MNTSNCAAAPAAERPPRNETAPADTEAADFGKTGDSILARRDCTGCGISFTARHPRHALCIVCRRWRRLARFVQALRRALVEPSTSTSRISS